MKKLLLLLLPVMIMSACKKEEQDMDIPQEIDCSDVVCESEKEFFTTCLINNSCHDFAWNFYRRSPTWMNFTLVNRTVNSINESLSFNFLSSTNLQDTIWVGWNDYSNEQPNIARSRYSYNISDATYGSFEFSDEAPGTKDDFLIIDYFNEDTTIVEGHFQLKFTDKSFGSSIWWAPEEMEIKCGRFRAEQFE